MEYLHNSPEEFSDAIHLASEKFGILPAVAEKDYYVTLILRGLAERLPYIVFKSGTSLSKCHKVIKRFSEDIDTAINIKLTQGQMRNVKEAVKVTTEKLGLIIPNIEETRSRRSYNKYIIRYKSVLNGEDEAAPPRILLETTTFEVSFPTVDLPVHNYVGDMMEDEAPDMIKAFQLEPFIMKVQGVDRTLIDKTFAICDYYLSGTINRHSRHIYDIYKLLPLVPQTGSFRNLIKMVRAERAKDAKICLSARPEIDVTAILNEIIDKKVYKADYDNLTSRILEENIPYDTAIKGVKELAESGLFS